MEKMIEINELPNGEISLKSSKGTKWTTFILGASMLVDAIIENANLDITIDDILEDIKIMRLNDKNEKSDVI